MPELLSGTRGLRTSAALVLAGAVLSGPLAMLVVSQTSPQPAWTTVDTFVDNYRPVHLLPYVLGYVLLTGFVLFAASCYALAVAKLRVRATAGLVFTAIYAALVFTNYTIQVGFIPRVLKDRPAYIADLTMANPSSFAWFLEMFGYAALGAACTALFDGWVFSTAGLISFAGWNLLIAVCYSLIAVSADGGSACLVQPPGNDA
jgi:hypothetical protein